MNTDIKKLLNESISVKKAIQLDSSLMNSISQACDLIEDSIKNHYYIFFCGNGGSAADAQHIAAELTGRFKNDRRPLKGILLGSNFSSITAISNDYGYKYSFSRELTGLSNSNNDILVCYSTSGNSENVLECVKEAKKMNIKTIGFTGSQGGKMGKLVDVLINIPSDTTARIQESHITISHIIFQIVEKKLISSLSL